MIPDNRLVAVHTCNGGLLPIRDIPTPNDLAAKGAAQRRDSPRHDL